MRFSRVVFIYVVCFVIGSIFGLYVGRSRGFPFVEKQSEWAIGIYGGESTFDVTPQSSIANPVLTAREVRDVPADFVADPFMLKENQIWYMFFEVMNSKTRHGDIGLATSHDGLNWDYRQIILDEDFHLSYPYVLKWKDEYYMVLGEYSVRLYKATDFPEKWEFAATLLSGDYYYDPSVLYYDEKWWMFTGSNDILRLFYADDLTGPWSQHPKSPIILANANIARSGGRAIVFNGGVYRYAQDCEPTYGNQVRAFKITNISITDYEEEEIPESPILESTGTGWNALGMHNIDPHQIEGKGWIACVDGYGTRLRFGIKN